MASITVAQKRRAARGDTHRDAALGVDPAALDRRLGKRRRRRGAKHRQKRSRVRRFFFMLMGLAVIYGDNGSAEIALAMNRPQGIHGRKGPSTGVQSLRIAQDVAGQAQPGDLESGRARAHLILAVGADVPVGDEQCALPAPVAGGLGSVRAVWCRPAWARSCGRRPGPRRWPIRPSRSAGRRTARSG